MSSLPQGTVTFLFSDIEGSTRLAKLFGDRQWAELLDEHRALLRVAFAAHAGMEVDTQGDGFFVVFMRATDALAAAVAGQRALLAHDWPDDGIVRVRIGLHTGEAVLRDSHYIGQEVHRASRICDAGHGGQTVLSQAAAELVRTSLSGGVALKDLGEHQLNGLGRPQRLFQLSAPGLAADFPRLRSLDAATNLPVERTSFVGREQEIADVRAELDEHRLVTLTGIGGAGKTRLALRVGALELGNFPDGVFFVDLAPVTDLDLVAQTVAAACGLSLGDSPGGDTRAFVDRLTMTLAPRRCLLLIDNCEHLLSAVAELVDQLMARCPRVELLATSREALGIEGEQMMQVPSLAVPDEFASGLVTDAMRLFADRARAVQSSFQLDAHTLAPVAEICRRLDGIPLAIEFAAPRIAHLSVQQIAERLEGRLRLLNGGRRRIRRQQTMSASLEWSHDLLAEEERIVFRRIAVFAGGFTLESAEAVCVDEGIASHAVLDLLGSLADKSLITVGQGKRGATRYGLLETVRLYALEKLEAAGETRTFRSRHRDHYLAWLEAMPLDSLVFGSESADAMGCEIDNLRVAAKRCVDEDRPDLVARLVKLMTGFWIMGNSYRAPKDLLDWALCREDRLSIEDRVSSHAILGWLLLSLGDPSRALSHTTRAIDLANGRVEPFAMTAMAFRAVGYAGLASMPGSDPSLRAEARHDAERAVASARKDFPSAWQACAETAFAYVELHLGDIEAAAYWFASSAKSCRGVAFKGWQIANAMSGLAASLHLLGQTEEALEASLSFLARQDLNDLPWLDSLVIEVIPALFAGGQQRRADHELLRRATAIRRNGVDLAPSSFLIVAAVIEFLRGRPERAGRLLGAGRSVGGAAKQVLQFPTPICLAYYMRYLPLVRAALGPDAARRARDEGRAMTLDEAFNFALEEQGP
ncbi:adenylate/guanylate cyclase domain-containing protein [Variovorax sp. J31P207]|uniref:ATP-binding protein n=1 Tax=Variovorax sp. J31P207 TaxID=3053510 RepID=UPI0025763F70|nr:adenylate/guanylate cyclase domain-containing protein [Variovorax sp. J31P207]MDM0072156.1 adenylate/guanylate cyclase domain-containing protein [Variovorax sp. J31P207]